MTKLVIGLVSWLALGVIAQASSWVTIGNPGNLAQYEGNRGHDEFGTYGDPPFAINGDGLGAVAYTYQISKYAVSIADWQPFYGDGTDGEDGIGGGTARGSFNSTYNYWNDGMGGRTLGEDAPAIRISLHQAAQYANWLTTGNATQGAYTIDGDGRVTAVNRNFRNNDGMLYAIASLDEWYKAFAYNGATGMYSLYANGGNDVDNPPLKSTDGLTGWNYDNAGVSWTGAATPWAVDHGTQEQNGTFNMMGNVHEWMEFDLDADYNWVPYFADAEVRGGTYNMDESHTRAYDYIPRDSATEAFTIGFRIVAIPEPRSAGLVVSGLVFVFIVAYRRFSR